MNTASPASSRRLKSFLVMGLLWLATAYFIGHHAASLPFGAAVLSVLILATPVALAGAYSSAIAQVRSLLHYKPSGWIFKFLSRRFLQTLAWGIWALLSSFLIFLQLILYSPQEWIALAVCIPVFWLVFATIRRMVSGELRKPYLVTDVSTRWSRLLTPFLMLTLFGATVMWLGEAQSFSSLSEALATRRADIPTDTDSALVALGLQLLTFSDGLKSYLAGNLQFLGAQVPLLFMIVGSYVVFFNACATLSCFVIPASEYRRVFGPSSEDDVPPALSKSRVALVSALITVLAVFIYLPLFAYTETVAREHPELKKVVAQIEREVERIDDAYYNRGTIKQLELARAEALGKLTTTKAVLESQIDRAFDQISNNVDRYLDWYYSLGAEYMRLAKLLTGDIEAYMEANLVKHIEQGEAVLGLSTAMASTLTSYEGALNEYAQKRKLILDNNRLADDGSPTKVVRTRTMTEILNMPAHLDVVQLQQRAAAGGVAAGVGAIVTAKVVSKGMIKMGAKAVSKVAISKASGAVGGAATGVAIGSVVPGIGTVIGGLLGGLMGGVVVDKLLLTLEEAFSRESFKKELLAAVEEARVEFKSKVFPAQ